MIGEGLFILVVSLSGNYTDNQYVGNFPNCTIAMEYYKNNCKQFKAASCLFEEYANLPDNHASLSAFDFNIKERQSCGFIGVDTRTFTKDKQK